MDDFTNDVGYYDPADSPEPFVAKMLYPAHIKNVTSREVAVKGKYKARVYDLTCEVASECSDREYIRVEKDGTETIVPGSKYVGKEFKSKGIFMFLNPKEGDSFQSNNGANERYLSFCESMGIEMKDIEIDVNGEKRTVKQFPILEKDNLLGKPVISHIDIETWKTKDGEERYSYKATYFEQWKEGQEKDYISDDIPF
jgi:uncharacterized OsmC-like protein